MADLSKAKDWADLFNIYRIFPRLFITSYITLFSWACIWFMGLPDPSATQAAFVSTLVGAGAAWFGLYVNSGPAVGGEDRRYERFSRRYREDHSYSRRQRDGIYPERDAPVEGNYRIDPRENGPDLS